MNTRLTAQATKSFFLARRLTSRSGPDITSVSWQSHSGCHRPSTLESSSLNSESENCSSEGPVLSESKNLKSYRCLIRAHMREDVPRKRLQLSLNQKLFLRVLRQLHVHVLTRLPNTGVKMKLDDATCSKAHVIFEGRITTGANERLRSPEVPTPTKSRKE